MYLGFGFAIFLKTNIFQSTFSYNISGECGARNIYLNDDLNKNLTSPRFPNIYPDDFLCEWVVNAMDEQLIYLHVIDFELEAGYDFLTLGNGKDSTNSSTRLFSFTGNPKAVSFTSSMASIWMNFASDRSGGRRGFYIQLSQTDMGDYGKYTLRLF